MTLLLEIMVPSISGELCWGIMSSILFMPVMHSAQVFPHFFTTDRELGLAFLPLDGQIQVLMENRTLPPSPLTTGWGKKKDYRKMEL